MPKQYVNPGPLTFEAVIHRNGEVNNSSAFITVPYDLKETFGVGNLVPITALFDDTVPYQGSLAKLGGPPVLILRKDVRAALGKQPGDSIKVVINLDEKPRELAVAADIQKALTTYKQLKYFDNLAFSHRREYIRWIEDAKKPETRANRIKKMIELLKDKKKDPR